MLPKINFYHAQQHPSIPITHFSIALVLSHRRFKNEICLLFIVLALLFNKGTLRARYSILDISALNILLVSSHHHLKNEACYTFILFVLTHDGLKKEIYYTHSLFNKN